METSVPVHSCNVCNKQFTNKRLLHQHIQRAHNVNWKEVIGNCSTGNVACNEENCGNSFQRLDELRNHLQQVHNFSFDKEKLCFESREDFLSWKKDLERKDKVSYVKSQGTKKSETHTVEYFWCNRSGKVRKRGLEKRSCRASGKIGTHCTSSLTATTTIVNCSVTVDVCHTHYGHESRLKFLRIPEDIRSTIAADLRRGVDASIILENIRATVGTNGLEREHLITRKDINNIRTVEKHKEDVNSCMYVCDVEEYGTEVEVSDVPSCMYVYDAEEHGTEVEVSDVPNIVGDPSIASSTDIIKKQIQEISSSLLTKVDHVSDENILMDVKKRMSQTLSYVCAVANLDASANISCHSLPVPAAQPASKNVVPQGQSHSTKKKKLKKNLLAKPKDVRKELLKLCVLGTGKRLKDHDYF